MNKITRTPAHFIAGYLLRPAHPITVTIIGAGGTGSHLIECLADATHTQIALGHPGFWVKVYDGDTVQPANIARSKFGPAVLNASKGEAIITAVNRKYGLNWQYEPQMFDATKNKNYRPTNLLISCVHDAATRFRIADMLTAWSKNNHYVEGPSVPYYWLDCGNSQQSGQVMLSTVGSIQQQKSAMFQTVSELPNFTQKYGHLLVDEPDLPSCSMWEAIAKQDLYINKSIAMTAANWLWSMLRNGFTTCEGILVNTATFEQRPIPITSEKLKPC